MSIRRFVAAAACFAASVAPAYAVSVTFGSGSAVSSVDRSATFDAIASGFNLDGYTEDGLLISVPDFAFSGFDPFNEGNIRNSGFHYGSGGNTSFVTIAALDNSRIFGIEFLLGHGQGSTNANVAWEALRGGSVVGSGNFATPRGSVVGFFDVVGFDELRVGANGSSYTALGQFQSIALDDLVADLTRSSSEVPLPGAVIPMLSGLGILAARRLRKKA